MKRTPLFGKRAESPSMWRARIVSAMRDHDAASVLAIAREPNGRVLLREGLEVGGTFQPFWMGCVALGAHDMLEAVLRAAPNGVTLDDCCIVHHLPEGPRGLEFESSIEPVYIAAREGDAAALGLALEFGAAPACINTPEARLDNSTLHSYVLGCAIRASMKKQGELAEAGGYAQCCRVLLARKVPFVGTKFSDVNTLFFHSSWHKRDAQEVIGPLLHDYFNAGLIDLDALRPGACRPATQAALVGNGYAAAAAITLGCNLALAVENTGHSDLHSLALAQDDLPLEERERCAMLVAEATMRRKLTAIEVAAVAPQAPRRAGV